MKRLNEVLSGHSLPKHEWNKNPKIGWWKDHDHLVMYHGTHDSRVADIAKGGLKAPHEGPTKGWVSMTHDPHTAHGYASMHGGESSFRKAGGEATHVPHEHRSVMIAHIPRKWAEENMDTHIRGNIGHAKDKLTNKAEYDQHSSSGKPDHEYYQTTELRFKNQIPAHFIVGYTKKPVTKTKKKKLRFI